MNIYHLNNKYLHAYQTADNDVGEILKDTFT